MGIESTDYTRWLAEMLQRLGRGVGEAAKIRPTETCKHKHDRRDAEHIVNLLVKANTPRIWLPLAGGWDVGGAH